MSDTITSHKTVEQAVHGGKYPQLKYGYLTVTHKSLDKGTMVFMIELGTSRYAWPTYGKTVLVEIRQKVYKCWTCSGKGMEGVRWRIG